MTKSTLFAAAGLFACAPASTPNLPTPIALDAGLFTMHRRGDDAGASVDAGDVYGSIGGEVTLFGADSSAGVQISVSPAGLSTVSNDDSGDFFLAPVPPGPFTLTFSAPGYATATLEDVLGPGDAADERLVLQRSIVLLLLDGGTTPWVDGGADAGRRTGITWLAGNAKAIYAATTDTLYSLDTTGATAHAMYTDPGGLLPVGLSSGGMAFLFAGLDGGVVPEGGSLSVLVAWDGGVELVDASGSRAESALIAGEHLFLATPQDAGGEPPALTSWASVGPGANWLQPELDNVLALPVPVVFGSGLAGYRQPTASSFQLMEFGSGSFQPIADSLLFLPEVLDSSPDGKLVTAVASASGYITDALLEVLELDGGASAVTGPGFVVNCTQAIPLSANELCFENTWGQFVVVAAPDTFVYLDYPLASSLRPGGSFLAELPGDGGESTILVTDNGDTVLPFGEPWTTPVFSPDGRYVVFTEVPTLYDLRSASQYTLIVAPATAAFNAQSDQALLIGVDGTLSLVDLTALPGAEAGGLAMNAQPVGTVLEGTAVSAAIFAADGSGIVYAGTNPHGENGVFIHPLQ